MTVKFIVAVITTESAHADKVSEALQAAVLAVRKEPGCIQYDLHQDLAKPGRFVMIEQWQDAQALKTHGEAEAFQKLSAVLDQYASLDITDLNKIA